MRDDVEPLSGHQLSLDVSAPDFGHLGHLVIDTAYEGRSVGGVRILPDVTQAEVSHMARLMSKKYLFSGLPYGGAKAGLVLKGAAAEDRRGALLAFGSAVSGLVMDGYWPGTDMGSTPDDVKLIFQGARCPWAPRSIPPTDKYTAWGVIESIDAAIERKGMGWSGLRLAIEGFGNVGSWVAHYAAWRGASVVAVSNTSGCIADVRGLDVPRMLLLRKSKGSVFINECGTLAPKEALFGADCDVLVPCARTWSIGPSEARAIRASVVVSAANVPMTLAEERYLVRKGVLVVPDGIANCGGSVGGALAGLMPEDDMLHVFRGRFRERVHEVMGPASCLSEWLESFCRRRKETLAGKLSPPGLARRLSAHMEQHLARRSDTKRRLLGGLFPEE